MWFALVVSGWLAAAVQLDVPALTVGPPATIAEIDATAWKGEAHRLAWSPDGSQLYVQLVAGSPPSGRRQHLLVDVPDGARRELDTEPDWAQQYWAMKQDIHAPGDPSLAIEVEQRSEIRRAGPGPSGVLDRSGSPDALTSGPSPDNLAAGQHGDQRVRVVRLSFAGREIASWINVARPVPGLVFSWGPEGSGALVYATEKGTLVVLNRKERNKTLPGASNAMLPAWSTDGRRLAWLQRDAKHRYAVVWTRMSATY